MKSQARFSTLTDPLHTESTTHRTKTWWRHPMETFFALLALCAGNSPVTGKFPSQGPVARSFDVFDLRLNKRLSKQSWGWLFETPLRSLWRHCNDENLHGFSTVHLNWAHRYQFRCQLSVNLSIIPMVKMLCFSTVCLTIPCDTYGNICL